MFDFALKGRGFSRAVSQAKLKLGFSPKLFNHIFRKELKTR
jgi:hypothetical protein